MSKSNHYSLANPTSLLLDDDHIIDADVEDESPNESQEETAN